MIRENGIYNSYLMHYKKSNWVTQLRLSNPIMNYEL